MAHGLHRLRQIVAIPAAAHRPERHRHRAEVRSQRKAVTVTQAQQAVLTARADLRHLLTRVRVATDEAERQELGRRIAFTNKFLTDYAEEVAGKRTVEPRQFKHVEATGFRVRGLRKAMHYTVKAAHRTWYGVRRTW